MHQSHTRYYLYAAGIILLVVTFLLRLVSYPIESGDYIASLSHWMDALRGSPGLTAFANPFSDYAPLYLYLLKLVSLVPIFDLYSIKTLSLIFDILLAYTVVKIVADIMPGRISTAGNFLIFAIVLALPTVMLNSSLWAQCDAIYVFFVLLTLHFILSDRPVWAAIFYGIAISFKLQAIFFLPILAGYYIGRRNISYMILLPFIFILTIIPAWLGGGSILGLLGTYLVQSRQFQALSLSAPSVFSFINESGLGGQTATVLAHMGELAGLVAALIIVFVVARIYSLDREKIAGRLLFLSLLAAVVIPFVLPHMHERYFYLADILSVVYAVIHPRRWYVPLAVVGASFLSYMPFLSGQVKLFAHLAVSMWVPGLVMAFASAVLIPRFVSLVRLAFNQYNHAQKIT